MVNLIISAYTGCTALPACCCHRGIGPDGRRAGIIATVISVLLATCLHFYSAKAFLSKLNYLATIEFLNNHPDAPVVEWFH